MEANVKAVEIHEKYVGFGKEEQKFVKVTFDPDNFGVAILYYPWEMASLFPLGKRVEITVSEAKDWDRERFLTYEAQKLYDASEGGL